MQRQEIFNFYLKNTARINNWDLVDVSAYKIIGRYIFDHRDNLDALDQLAESNNIWERRIAIISTYYFLTHGISSPTIHIAQMLLGDEHDLIQKATGWMLRELGKRVDEAQLIAFLHANYSSMPRITLRYAIERFDPITRKKYLAGDFEQSP